MIENTQLDFPCVENALHRLCPGARWAVRYGKTDDEYEIDWMEKDSERPSDEEIAAAIAVLAENWELRDYITKRKASYPPLSEFADAFYWLEQSDDSKMRLYLERVELVKQRYPKPKTDAVVVEVTPTPEYVHRDLPPQAGEEPIA